MSTYLEWPFFSKRTDFIEPVAERSSGQVIRKFSSGFDAGFGDELYFFTHEMDALHPMSVLVPPSLLDLINETDRIVCSPGQIQAGVYQLSESSPVKPADFQKVKDPEMIRQNCMVLHAALKLFARPSIVHAMIMGCNTQKNILSEAQKLLLEDELDINLLAEFMGMGEGLTPAFDDFFSGMLFIDRFYSFNRIYLPDGFIEKVEKKTTRQALQQIKLADAGALSLRFEQFFARMANSAVRTHEVVRLLEYGHTSGADILCGVWFYLAQKVRM